MFYRGFIINVIDKTVYIIDPKLNKCVLMSTVPSNDVIYYKALVDQYIYDCAIAERKYNQWARVNLTCKQYHDWITSKTA
jgi:hypothetical protein